MFEKWPAEFDPPPHLVVDPPTPVIVHVGTAVGQSYGQPANAVPLG